MCYNPSIAELSIDWSGKKAMVFRNVKKLTKQWKEGKLLVKQTNYPNTKMIRSLPKNLRKELQKTKSLNHYLIPTKIACRKCEKCLERKSKEWAMRAMHEASLYGNGQKNSALTLTISPEAMKERGHTNVSRREVQLFLKKLRKHKEKTGDRIRVMYCAEYGDQTQRPHYHAIIFNCVFEDKIFDKVTRAGTKLYKSETLTKIWGLGHVWIGEVTYKTAAYIARYTFKKLAKVDNHQVKEFIQASNRPGLAREWLDQYGLSDIYNKQLARVQEPEVIPRYYDEWLKKTHEEIYNQIKKYRCETMDINSESESYERAKREQYVKQLQYKKLVRGTVEYAEA